VAGSQRSNRSSRRCSRRSVCRRLSERNAPIPFVAADRLSTGRHDRQRKQSKGDNPMANTTRLPAVVDMKLELVPIPVSDVDRAKAFYEKIGFGDVHDTQVTESMRVVQFTPPGSACAIVFGTGMSRMSALDTRSIS